VDLAGQVCDLLRQLLVLLRKRRVLLQELDDPRVLRIRRLLEVRVALVDQLAVFLVALGLARLGEQDERRQPVWTRMYFGVPKKRATRSAPRPNGSSPKVPCDTRCTVDGIGSEARSRLGRDRVVWCRSFAALRCELAMAIGAGWDEVRRSER